MSSGLLVLLLAAEVVYAVACAILGSRPGAPLWLRWPLPIWNAIAHDWRPSKPAPRRPDYAKIARLERELGFSGAPERELSPFEEGMRRAIAREAGTRRKAKICLAKGCLGGTREIRTVSGAIIARVHECD